MSDFIKREDAIEALTAEFYITGRENARTILNYVDLVKTRIKAIPSADRPQEWIPCSERLPKENTEVLMSLEWGIDIGECRNGDWHSEWINHYDDGNVLAWMPLPKPWKGAGSEKSESR